MDGKVPTKGSLDPLYDRSTNSLTYSPCGQVAKTALERRKSRLSAYLDQAAMAIAGTMEIHSDGGLPVEVTHVKVTAIAGFQVGGSAAIVAS